MLLRLQVREALLRLGARLLGAAATALLRRITQCLARRRIDRHGNRLRNRAPRRRRGDDERVDALRRLLYDALGARRRRRRRLGRFPRRAHRRRRLDGEAGGEGRDFLAFVGASFCRRESVMAVFLVLLVGVRSAARLRELLARHLEVDARLISHRGLLRERLLQSRRFSSQPLHLAQRHRGGFVELLRRRAFLLERPHGVLGVRLGASERGA